MKNCPLCKTKMILKQHTYELISGNVYEGSVDVFDVSSPSYIHFYWECPKCRYTLNYEKET